MISAYDIASALSSNFVNLCYRWYRRLILVIRSTVWFLSLPRKCLPCILALVP